MKKFLDKLRDSKGLPIELIGTSLLEVLLFCLVVLSLVGIFSFVFTEFTTLLIWLFVLTTWAFLHIRKSALTQERFEEIDQRDLDFKDECDRHFARLDELKDKLHEHYRIHGDDLE